MPPPASATQQELLALVDRLNRDAAVDGILVQLPLPLHLDAQQVLRAIDPGKDVDAFHPENVGRLLLGQPQYLPCTPSGIMELLRAYDISPAGKRCVVIGRSNIVSQVSLTVGDEVIVRVKAAAGVKCGRCWKVLHSVASVGEHEALCPRCAAVMAKLPKME